MAGKATHEERMLVSQIANSQRWGRGRPLDLVAELTSVRVARELAESSPPMTQAQIDRIVAAIPTAG